MIQCWQHFVWVIIEPCFGRRLQEPLGMCRRSPMAHHLVLPAVNERWVVPIVLWQGLQLTRRVLLPVQVVLLARSIAHQTRVLGCSADIKHAHFIRSLTSDPAVLDEVSVDRGVIDLYVHATGSVSLYHDGYLWLYRWKPYEELQILGVDLAQLLLIRNVRLRLNMTLVLDPAFVPEVLLEAALRVVDEFFVILVVEEL